MGSILDAGAGMVGGELSLAGPTGPGQHLRRASGHRSLHHRSSSRMLSGSWMPAPSRNTTRS